ncbi:MAG TPA: DUF2267 domain-containing protein [Hyphomicrobiales bacterium]|nr:DUF2267 domain-containing protein [Hyphomicrobiales bacterium]
MQELISRIVEHVGVDQGVAEKAVQIVLDFLGKEGPQEQIEQLKAALPEFNIASAASGGGLFGGGGLLGGLGGMGAAMAALNELTSAGLGMGEVQGTIKEIVAYAKEKAGDEVVDQIVGSIPGIGQFV